MIKTDAVVDGETLHGLPGILRVKRILMEFQVVNRNCARLRVTGCAAEQEIGIDVARGRASVILKVVRPLKCLTAGLLVTIAIPVEAELHGMGAIDFAQIVVEGGIGLEAAKSAAIERAAEDRLRVVAGEPAIGAPANQIRDLHALRAEKTGNIESEIGGVDGGGVFRRDRVDVAGVGKDGFVGQSGAEHVGEVGHHDLEVVGATSGDGYGRDQLGAHQT